MRKLLGLAPALLCACATAPAEPPVRGETPGHTCTIAGTKQFVGRLRSRETEEAIKRATHAAVLRWAPPGSFLTMDYRSDRVTVRLGPDNKITEMSCG